MRNIVIQALAVTVSIIAFGAPAAAQLVPHRAVYQLSLNDSQGSVVDANGLLAMEWRDACDGWVSNQQLMFVASTDGGRSFDMDVRFTSWESDDNTKLRFTTQTFSGGRLLEKYEGHALLDRPGGSGRALYSLPNKVELDLPQGTVFPTEHVRRLLNSARSGQFLASHQVFDGAGPASDALNLVTAFIGQRAVAERDSVTDSRQWPMSLAYFQKSDDALPSFEVTFDLGDNGVMRALSLDYGDFVLGAALEQLTMLEQPAGC
ncbi:MAG: EipB family protein [Geminicoccaceae bacterium]